MLCPVDNFLDIHFIIHFNCSLDIKHQPINQSFYCFWRQKNNSCDTEPLDLKYLNSNFVNIAEDSLTCRKVLDNRAFLEPEKQYM